MEANWKLFGQTYETEYQLARRRTFLKIDLDQLTKNVNILRKLCSDHTGKICFLISFFPGFFCIVFLREVVCSFLKYENDLLQIHLWDETLLKKL